MQNEDFEEEVYVDVNSLPLRPPQPMIPPEKAVRRPWHPVMWDDSLIGIHSHDHRDTDDEVDRRPRWEAPYITFAEAEKARIKNSRTPTDSEREMTSVPVKNLKAKAPFDRAMTDLLNWALDRTCKGNKDDTNDFKALTLKFSGDGHVTCHVKVDLLMRHVECAKRLLQRPPFVQIEHVIEYVGDMPKPQSRGEYPHKQRIRNLRKLIADGKVKPTPETLIFFLCNKFAISDDRQKKVVV